MNAEPTRAVRGLILATAVGLLTGCFGTGPAREVGRSPRAVPYRRIAVIEFHDGSRYSSYGYAGDFSRALAQKLAEWTTGTDVVILPREALDAREEPFFTGTMPLNCLVQVRKQCHAEAAIVGNLDEIDPYRMPSAHVSLKVLDTASGAVLFEVSETWDASERSTCREIEAYHDKNRESDECRFGTDLFLNSPRYFLRFVADRVACRVTEAL
ncbi:MAG: hypothetical protein PVJ27_09285 [Candidatus Brocadiaceae bacterium]|jgi:hypothetical protein